MNQSFVENENVKIVGHNIVLDDCVHELDFYEESAPATITGSGTPRTAKQFNRF